MDKMNFVDELTDNMTIEEKAMLINGVSFFRTAAIERLNIPKLQFLDGGTGINFEQLFGDFTQVYKYNEEDMIGSTALNNVIDNFYNAEKIKEENRQLYYWIKEKLEDVLIKHTDKREYSPGCFPPGILLGATFNPEVVYRVGEALGMEACIYGINILLGTPNVNIHRDPLNGRLFEGYSEDPFLVSSLAPKITKGVQKYGVCANVKHFAANNQETNRVGINEIISKRALEEIYLPGFKACVKEGNVQTVMSAYNQINGISCTENSWLLTDKLRNEWGFGGMVVSDWGAVRNIINAVKAGNDLAMPGPRNWKCIVEAVEAGELSNDELDKPVKHILNILKWIQDNKNEILSNMSIDEIRKFSDNAAYKAACEGFVLLKNEGVLPIADKHIYMVGTGSEKLIECGTGSAGINTDRTCNLYEYLTEYLGEDNVSYGLPEKYDDNAVVLCLCSLNGMEGNDRTDLYLDEADLQLLSEIDLTTIVVLNTCGPVDFSFMNNTNIKALIEVFLTGMEGGHALADILVGKVNPSGKLPITFPKKYEDAPTYINFPGDGYEVNYGEGIYVGYRYYDKKKIEPAFAFGYGLSYTHFLCKLENVFIDKDIIRINVKISNEGNMSGSEVIQIYVGDPYSTLSKPVKELKAFTKVFLENGEEKNVNISIPINELASYDADIDKWIIEEGYYDIYAATSSRIEDVFGEKRIYLDVKSPYSYGINSTVKILYENFQLRDVMYKIFDEYNLDRGIIESNYQYTSNKTLKDILCEYENYFTEDKNIKSFIEDFDNRTAKIYKK